MMILPPAEAVLPECLAAFRIKDIGVVLLAPGCDQHHLAVAAGEIEDDIPIGRVDRLLPYNLAGIGVEGDEVLVCPERRRAYPPVTRLLDPGVAVLDKIDSAAAHGDRRVEDDSLRIFPLQQPGLFIESEEILAADLVRHRTALGIVPACP